MKKPKVIDIKLKTKQVKGESIRIDAKLKIGKPVFDCCDDECAKFWGFAGRDEYRRKMNSKQGYKDVIKMMGK